MSIYFINTIKIRTIIHFRVVLFNPNYVFFDRHLGEVL